MADQGGVSRVAGGLVAGVSGQRPAQVGGSQSRNAVAVSGSGGQGVGRREVPDAKNRQLVNLDGKVMNRAAPRGTYLDILV